MPTNHKPGLIGAHRCRCGCGATDLQGEVRERFSLGITAGYWCDKGWKSSGYRKEGPEGFDYLDAGEYYDERDY